MAGLAGWTAPAARPLDEGGVLPMLQALSHRHGEEETLLACTEVRRGQQVVLGATLRDPASGIAAALDGTFANAAELRATLGGKGFQFAGKSSVELLLRAYQYWDKDVVRHLRGAFAFSIWDPRKDRLMLARDRFGEKPLFVSERGGGLHFASEAKALLAAPGARAEVDLGAMRACLAHGFVPGTETLFRGIRRLPPATYAMWQFGRLQETRYWTPPDRHPWAGRPVVEKAAREAENSSPRCARPRACTPARACCSRAAWIPRRWSRSSRKAARRCRPSRSASRATRRASCRRRPGWRSTSAPRTARSW